MVDFETNALTFRNAGITAIAASVDSVDKTAALFAGLHLRTVKVFAELDLAQVVAATGARTFESEDRAFLHATGFVIDPEDRVDMSCYASGPIGRFTASEILRMVAFRELQRDRAKD